MEPRWLTRAMVLALHDESLTLFGGLQGVRDHALLESALARPQNRYVYESDVDLSSLAAEYGFGLVRKHAFLDGNKRVAVLSVTVFLGLNNRHFDPDEVDEVRTILALAAGELSIREFSAWIQACCDHGEDVQTNT